MSEAGRRAAGTAVGVLACVIGVRAEPVRLTPADAIQTARLMIDASTSSARNPDGSISLSPGGRWWVARVVRGDVAANGVWMELHAGRADTVRESEGHVVGRWFSTGLGAGEGRAGPNLDTLSEMSPLVWVNEDTVTFAWSDVRSERQVIRVNLSSGEVRPLTHHPTSVLNFAAADDGTVVFSAIAPVAQRPLDEVLRQGVVIEPQTDAASLIRGYVNQGSVVDRLWRSQWFVQRADGSSMPLSLAGRAWEGNPYERAWISPDGGEAVIATVAPRLSETWERYESEEYQARLKHARQNPQSLLGRLVYQFFLVNLASGSNRPLWDAAVDADVVKCVWSPDQKFLAVGPTFLPAMAQDSKASLLGQSVAVVDLSSGEWSELPLTSDESPVQALRWRDPASVDVEVGLRMKTRTVSFMLKEGHWRRVERRTSAANDVRFVLRQSLDTPPVLWAERRGEARKLIDPNPDLAARFSLGKSEYREGRLDDTRRWRARMFYPPGFDRSRRYPLVIQSVYGDRGSSEFTLYGYGGYGLGPSIIPPYPGRLLAQRGILVAQFNIEGDTQSQTPLEAALRGQAFASFTQALVDEGIVDDARVGLLGFSRNGYFVEHALTHPLRRYAAAVAVDHFDAGYVAQTLLGYDMGGADVNGGVPFDETLGSWLKDAPGFSASRIEAPLLQIEQSHGLLGVVLRWETFSRLRYLGKPVELWLVPNAQYGVHNSQNPEQIIAQQTRVIDWFRFWLKGETDDDPAKVDQYRRWHELARLQRGKESGHAE